MDIETYKARLQEILQEAYSLFEKKVDDYEDADNPLRTFRLAGDLNIAPWKGSLLRMGDKMSLLYTWVRDGKYSGHDEPPPETLLDIIIYAGLTIVLYEQDDELNNLSMTELIQMIQQALTRKSDEA